MAPDNAFGYDTRIGFRPTQPTASVRAVPPNRIHIRAEGVEYGPDFDPSKAPSNADRGSGVSRGAMQLIGNILGQILDAVGGALIDILGPVVDPYK